MDRRDFLHLSALGLAGLSFGGSLSAAEAMAGSRSRKNDYSVVILGDTHFDTDPDSVYHTGYSDPNPTREANHRKEFVRNADMWKERMPKLVKRAACLADDDTKAVFHMGDLIQGDCGDMPTHAKMLGDCVDYMKEAFGPLPFVTVAGNHDLRGRDDREATQAYQEYMTAKMSEELGKKIEKTTFGFTIGKDAYIVIDFTHPDDEEVERLLSESRKARYTFIIVHGPVFPYDSEGSYNWIFHGKDDTPEKRHHFRELFAKRKVIVLCGHVHTTELADWYGDGGRITQMTMTSVWSKQSLEKYTVEAEGASEYGALRIKTMKKNGTEITGDEMFEEYRPGLKTYIRSKACGSYKMHVSDEGVTIDFYGGDSTRKTQTFKLR